MSRGFNKNEKKFIRSTLIKQGKILFSRYGFQKTSIHELTKSVGIAQGTFYNFFNSKEELYFAILELEEEKIKEQLAQVNLFKENEPKKAIKQILRELIKTIETNPLIRELYFGDNLKKLLRKLPPESLEKHFKKDASALVPLIEIWKSEGIILKENPEIIAGVLRSLFVLTLNQKEIGEAIYEETIELFIDLIVDGIVKEG